jgi:hypothetical protein
VSTLIDDVPGGFLLTLTSGTIMPTAATKTKHTGRHHADAPAEPPAPHRAVNAHWMFDGWKGALNRATPDERVRTAVITDVNRAATDATHRRAVGQPGKAHPLAQIGRVVSGLSARALRSAKEPIRAGELAEIERSLAAHDELAAVYSLAAAAAEAMTADARRAFEGPDPAPGPIRPFGNPAPYLNAASERLGLPVALISRAIGNPELHRMASKLGPRQIRLRLTGDTAFRPDQMTEIRTELDLADREAGKLKVLAAASLAMILEARVNLGLELPAAAVRSSHAGEPSDA